MQENKKIRNATPLEYNGIQFKSVLEKAVYKTFLENGFEIEYEPIKFTLWKGFKPTIPFFDKDNSRKSPSYRALTLNNKKIIDIHYTPDFIVHYAPNIIAYIEAKGMENDVFYIKKKLFRQALENMKGYFPMYFEVYTKANILQAIQIIKDYAEKLKRD